MHVLTKIFVVLVSMLAILLTPLVVVYAHNEDNFKAKYEQQALQATAMRTELGTAQARAGADSQRVQDEIARLNSLLSEKQAGLDRALADAREIQSQLATARSFQGENRSQLAILTAAVSASQELTERLIGEVGSVRNQALETERRLVELDEAYNDVTSQLEVAVSARKMLEEELTALNTDHADSLALLSEYLARYGALNRGDIDTGAVRLADRDIFTSVVNVSRGTNGETLAEIDAGTRDGVQEGLIFTIGDADFVANLRIINVDINRATGVVELENVTGRSVTPGQKAYVRKGQS